MHEVHNFSVDRFGENLTLVNPSDSSTVSMSEAPLIYEYGQAIFNSRSSQFIRF